MDRPRNLSILIYADFFFWRDDMDISEYKLRQKLVELVDEME